MKTGRYETKWTGVDKNGRNGLTGQVIACPYCPLLSTSSSQSILELSKEQSEKIHQMFESIGKLAGAIHQGSLMSEMALDLRHIDQGVHGKNLFQKACQEAIQDCTEE